MKDQDLHERVRLSERKKKIERELVEVDRQLDVAEQKKVVLDEKLFHQIANAFRLYGKDKGRVEVRKLLADSDLTEEERLITIRKGLRFFETDEDIEEVGPGVGQAKIDEFYRDRVRRLTLDLKGTGKKTSNSIEVLRGLWAYISAAGAKLSNKDRGKLITNLEMEAMGPSIENSVLWAPVGIPDCKMSFENAPFISRGGACAHVTVGEVLDIRFEKVDVQEDVIDVIFSYDRESEEEWALKNFLNTEQYFFGLARDEKESDERQMDGSSLWSAMRNARLFYVPAETYVEVFEGCDEWVSREVGIPHGELDEVAAGAFKTRCTELSKKIVELPPTSFDYMFLGYGSGVWLGKDELQKRTGHQLTEEELGNVFGALLLGHLIAPSFVVEIVVMKGKERSVMSYGILRSQRGWVQADTLTPWTVSKVLSLLNEYRSFAVEKIYTEKEKRIWKKGRGEEKKMPPPFYVLKLKDDVVREWRRKIRGSKTVLWSHRWDVRGHERIRVRKGALPVPEEIQRDLLKRGYRIYTFGSVPKDIVEMLKERKIGIGEGEWIAFKKGWVSAHVKGPDGAPYIPALRILP